MAVPTRPATVRNGDSWKFTWDDGAVFDIERLRDARDGLHAELTVIGNDERSWSRIAGPISVNLLSNESHSRLATSLGRRATKFDWLAMLSYACGTVAQEYRQPAPTLDLAELEDTGAIECLVPRLVPRGETTLMYGDGESLKSLLAQRIVLSCRCPSIALPWGDVLGEAVNVLYLDYETNAHTVASRLRRLAAGIGISTIPSIHYRGATRSGNVLRSLEDELPNLRAEISRLKIGLVIVDSVGFACNGPLTEDQTARAVLNCLRQLEPATRLVIAHVSAETARQASGKARPFGSTFFWNGMRSGIEVRRSEDGPVDLVDLGLYHRKANDGEHHRDIGLRVSFDGIDGAIRFDRADLRDVPDLLARTSLSERIRAALTRGQLDTRQMADALDVSESVVRTTLSRMAGVVHIDPGARGKPAIWGLSA